MGTKYLGDELPIKLDKGKGPAKLAGIRLFRGAAIATQTTKVDFARYDEHGHKQGLQKPALRFGKLKAMKYLFCSFHGAVVSVGEVSLTCRSKIPSSEHGTFLSKFVHCIDLDSQKRKPEIIDHLMDLVCYAN